MKWVKISLMIMFLFLVTAVPVLAQANETTGSVTGQIVNQTPTGSVPEGLALMLHAWDGSFAEKLMLNGQSGPNGTFQFEEVTLNADWLYAVMLTYQDVLYFSEPIPVAEDQTTLSLEIPIFEVTANASQVQVERQHILFDAGLDGLRVAEIYILSNLGDQTIAGSPGDDRLLPPLQFTLPEGAANVTFEGEDGRYLRTPSGFVDTTPLRPGTGKSQVVVQYVLPYTDGLTYSVTAQWPVAGMSFLVPETSGLSLEGEGLINEGTRDMGDGRRVTVFTYRALAAGDRLSVNLSGELVTPPEVLPSDTASESALRPSSPTPLALGGIILGLALIVVGVWWYRRPNDGEEDPTLPETAVNEFDNLVIQIARLDETYDIGAMDEETYQLKRAALRQQAVSTLHHVNPV